MCRYICSVIVLIVAVVVGIVVSGEMYNLIEYITGNPILVGFGPNSLTPHQKNYFTFNDIPNLSGKLSLITGANSGIGYYTALHLALHGSDVILACRSSKKCEEAADKIRRNSTTVGKLFTEEVDLSDMTSVDKFSKEILKKYNRLDYLILNAGISQVDPGIVNGIPGVFASNHLGHFKLYLDLQKLIKNTATKYNTTVTITHVSSGSHYDANTTIYLESLDYLKLFNEISLDEKYQFTKLCNVLFSHELARKFLENNDNNILSNSIHPGAVITGIFDPFKERMETNYPGIRAKLAIGLLDYLTTKYFWSTEDGSLTQLFAAVSPLIINSKTTGKYYHPIGIEMKTNPLVTIENQKKLWDISLKLLKNQGFNQQDN